MTPASGSGEPVSAGLSIYRTEEVILTLSGELDFASAPDLETRLGEVWAEGHTSVVLDLSGLEFVDSAGVSVLIRAKNEADATGSVLLLRRPTAKVHNVFALVGLLDWLSPEDAGSQPEG